MSTDNSGIRGSGKVTWQALAGIMMTIIMTIATALAVLAYRSIADNVERNEARIDRLTIDQQSLVNDVSLLKYKMDTAIGTLAQIQSDIGVVKRNTQ